MLFDNVDYLESESKISKHFERVLFYRKGIITFLLSPRKNHCCQDVHMCVMPYRDFGSQVEV